MLKQEIDLRFSPGLNDGMGSFPENSVLPCSVYFEKQETGGIFINCAAKEMEYFGINQDSLPEPPLRFRMLNFKHETFIIEIWMQFGHNPEKHAKLHLNPHDEKVQRFLALVSDTKMISFHFHNTGSQDIFSGVTDLNDEEEGWFNRNYELSTNLTKDWHNYAALEDHLCEDSDTDRFFKQHDVGSLDCFVNNGNR